MDRNKLVDGVSLRIVERELRKLASSQLKGYSYEFQTGPDTVVLLVDLPDRRDLELSYRVDQELVPLRPYWWWQLLWGDKPINFGRASMSSFYKTTLAEHVALLWQEL